MPSSSNSPSSASSNSSSASLNSPSISLPASSASPSASSISSLFPVADRQTILASFHEYYLGRYNLFLEENRTLAPGKNVVFLGDSLTEQFDAARFLPGLRCVNRGIGGDTLGLPGKDTGLLHRLDISVRDCNPSHVFLLIGVNEFWEPRPLDDMERAYRQIVATIREMAPDAALTLQTCTPTRESFASFNEGVREWNQRILGVARDRSLSFHVPISLLDTYALMVDGRGELRAEFSTDGIHLTPAAYEVWSREIMREIKKAMGK